MASFSGLCAQDLVFDTTRDGGATLLYYKTAINGPVVLYLIPGIMALMAVLVLRRLLVYPG